MSGEVTHTSWRQHARDEAALEAQVKRAHEARQRVLALHVPHQFPARTWSSDGCAKHQYATDDAFVWPRIWPELRACPDCVTDEVPICSHCRPPDDVWPCPTARAVYGLPLSAPSTSRPVRNAKRF